MNLYRQGSQEPQQVQDEDLKLAEDVDKQSIEVVLTFTIKNWGREPVTYSLGSPRENSGSHILYPETPLNLYWKYRTSVNYWMRISKGEARLDGPPDSPPSLLTLWVPISNLDNTVNDMHRWDSYIMPITEIRWHVSAHPGSHILNTSRRITYFEREWIPLREEKTQP